MLSQALMFASTEFFRKAKGKPAGQGPMLALNIAEEWFSSPQGNSTGQQLTSFFFSGV